MKSVLLFLIIIGNAINAFSQDSISVYIKPELRTRMEYRDGFQKLAPENSTGTFFISQRSRLGFGIETSKIKIKFTPQDVRVWGDEQYGNTAGITGNDASLDLFEAYSEINLLNNHWVSIGRQTLSYHNGWLLSDRNWNQNGIASDAVVLKLKYDNYAVHAGSSWNSLKENAADNFYLTSRYKTLNYLWLNRDFKNSKLTFLHISTGQTETDTTNNINFKHTSGLYFNKNTEKFAIHANSYYQYGKNQLGKDVGAFMFHSDIKYKFSKLHIGGGLTYFSGNKTVGAEQSTDKNFDLIYTARHKFLGNMDYFTNIGLHTKQGGLIDYALNVNFNLSKKFTIQNSSHIFSLAQTNANTTNIKELGIENDFILKFKANKWASIEGGYMFFLPSKSMQVIQNVPNSKYSSFAYLQLTVNMDNIYIRKQ